MFCPGWLSQVSGVYEPWECRIFADKCSNYCFLAFTKTFRRSSATKSPLCCMHTKYQNIVLHSYFQLKQHDIFSNGSCFICSTMRRRRQDSTCGQCYLKVSQSDCAQIDHNCPEVLLIIFMFFTFVHLHLQATIMLTVRHQTLPTKLSPSSCLTIPFSLS